MKKIVVALMLITFVAAVSYAADSVTYPAVGKRDQAVTFNHKAHQANFKCAKCHPTVKKEVGALTAGAADKNARKKAAHDFCKDCHKANDGPTGCSDCHTR